jgi:hypothetical protein
MYAVFLFSPQVLFETLFTLINTYQITFQFHTETYLGLHVKGKVVPVLN